MIACKPVTVTLRDADRQNVTTVHPNPDGTFSVTVPAGEYRVDAEAEGFPRARTIGDVLIPSGGTTTIPTLTLLAGDIVRSDNLNETVIDQLDAMSIGMNYNKAEPPAADLNCDGIINVLDLELLAANYREMGGRLGSKFPVDTKWAHLLGAPHPTFGVIYEIHCVCASLPSL